MAKDLRKFREEAARALEKGNFKQAAALYRGLAEMSPSEPALAHRAGELYKKVGAAEDALLMLTVAAEGYSKGGFLLKAIAVCKLILEIDRHHTRSLDLMADLYAREAQSDGATSLPAGMISAPPAQSPPPPSPQRRPAPRPAPAPAVGRAAAAAPAAGDFGALPPTGNRPRVPKMEIRGVPAAALEKIVLGRSVPDARPAEVLLGRDPFDTPEAPPVAPARAAEPPRRPRRTAALAAVSQAEEAPSRPKRTSRVFDIPLVGDDVPHATAPRLAPLAPLAPMNRESKAVAESEISAATAPEEEAESSASVRARLAAAAQAAVLPRIPLFSELPRPALRELLTTIGRARYPADRVIIQEGEIGDALYVIVHGEVRVVAGKDENEIARLGPGAFFGEIALLTDFPRGATVIAVEQAELLVINRAMVQDLIAKWPKVLTVLLRFLKDRLAQSLLRSSPLFESFTDADKLDLFGRFHLLEAEAGADLIEQGKPSPGLFLALAGKLDVIDPSRGDAMIARMAPGDLFGEMSLIHREPAVASVRARTKAFVLQLPRAKFQEVIMTHPQVLEYISDLAARRRAKNEKQRVDFI